ncbi:extracellular solute-binding protein [Bacillus mangrovi]|uniref:Maltodextrin-binding protein n=1 Tax=Metabacillus mangrovi TaxID=1491830 RepID=A0A7X2S6Q6_9BACI|nr:maltose ABC transporter substrate-binding protein [Metabacillus mangrovi]MTH54278.1 extracellular solute-binding protein [Metabacillus mangrovi]
MKKACLWMLVLLIALAGCSKPGGSTESKGQENQNSQATGEIKPEENAELIFWNNSGKETEWAKMVAEKFTEKYGIPVKTQQVADIDALKKLEVDGPAGLGGDVFLAPHDQVGKLVKSGLILENMVAENYETEVMEAALNGISYLENGEKKVYGFPATIETYALYYNKDLVEKPAETMDELIEQSKKIQSGSDGKYGFMLEPNMLYTNYSFMAGYGAYVFGKEGTDAADIGLNNEGAVKGAKLLQRFHKELLPLKSEDLTGDVVTSFFSEGNLAYRINGPWDIKTYADAGVNFGVVPLPKLDNGQTPKSFAGTKAYFVNAYSDYPKAATLLAQFASSNEMMEKRFEMTGQIPPYKALLDSDAIKNDEYAQSFLKQAQSAESMPNIPEMQAVWEPMNKALTAIWNNNQEPESTLNSAIKQIEDTIRTQQK